MAALFANQTYGAGISSSSPGCAVAISDHGSVVYARGFGLADLATRAPITPTTIMDIGSVSKQFVGASILLLAQDHQLSLGDDIHKFVPELAAYGHPLPLWDLLWMESGLPDYLNAGLMTKAGYAPADRVTGQQVLAVIARIHKLDFAPGSAAAYSNTNYFLLGLVVARVSGEPLAAFEQAHIFGPLGMRSTTLQDGSAPVPSDDAPSYLSGGTTDFTLTIWPMDGEGPGGVHTDVLDLLRWAQNFASGTVGGPAFLKAQLEAGPADASAFSGPDGTYAAGLALSTYRGQPVIFHGGSWEGFRTALDIEPESGHAIAITCNMDLGPDPTNLGLLALDTWFGT